MVTIKLFGTLRLKTGFKGTEADITSVKEAWQLLSDKTGLPAKEFKKCIVAINGVQTKASAPLQEGDEIAFFSPSGGG
jgi:molybdopterin converting factor small subunit